MADDTPREGDLRWYMTPGERAIVRVRVHAVVNSVQIVVSDLADMTRCVVDPRELFLTASGCKERAINKLHSKQCDLIRLMSVIEKDLLSKKRGIKELQKGISHIRKIKVKK